MKRVSILFARSDSEYKQIDECDVWDKERNAMIYDGDLPVIAHPPCRAWGVLSHMADPDPGEKNMARLSVMLVRKNGGILEHPVGSGIWKEAKLSALGMFADDFGGYTIDVDQYHFGHVAHKMTRLYICGCSYSDLPVIPFRKGLAEKSMTGQVKGTRRCTQFEREYTPIDFAWWLIETAVLCSYD